MIRLGIFLAMISTVALALADPRDFVVNVRPIFESTSTWSNAPLAIELENRGRDAKGQILVLGIGATTRYPVELPTGSKKRDVVYGGDTQFGMLPELIFDSDQGRFEIPYTSRATYNYGNTYIIALISDNAGELGFLRQQGNRNQDQAANLVTDAYCPPENAPDRPVGFQGLALVVLGEGSERLSDQSVDALKSYALTGGTLLFIGGASAPTLADPRWSGFLPVENLQTKTIPGGGYFNGVSDSITVASGTPIGSANVRRAQGIAMFAERAFGIGRVAFLAYNPFEDPVSRWQGRPSVFLQVARVAGYQRANQFLTEWGGGNRYDEYSSMPTPTAMGGRTFPTIQPSRQDPFSVELPGANKVFWILAAFFITVVPVNFLVLRKLGRGEWAWVSAPLISLVFAGIFLNQASDLYAASLSTATNGVVIVQEGMPEAMFVGSTQIFFPSGGSYDLNLKDVDQLGAGMDEYSPYQRRQQSRSQLDPIDNGSVQIPDLRAANLAFEDIWYRQRIFEVPKLQVGAKAAIGGQARVTVKNLTPATLSNGVLVVAGRTFPMQPLVPGGEVGFTVPLQSSNSDERGSFLESFSGVQKVIVVSGDVDILKPGPQLGNQVAGRSKTRLVYVAPLDLAGESK